MHKYKTLMGSLFSSGLDGIPANIKNTQEMPSELLPSLAVYRFVIPQQELV